MSPLIRKVYEIGGCKVISLPKTWIEFFEKKHGVSVTKVAVEVDHVLKVIPIIEKEQEKGCEQHG